MSNFFFAVLVSLDQKNVIKFLILIIIRNNKSKKWKLFLSKIQTPVVLYSKSVNPASPSISLSALFPLSC